MVKNIAIEKICPNKDNPYKIREEEMEPLMDSIYQYGIVQPLLVAKIDDTDKYTIISGHRRYLAAVRLCLEEIPAKILEISKDEADILLVDSNLHRENISISEKAFAYKMKFDATVKLATILSQISPSHPKKETLLSVNGEWYIKTILANIKRCSLIHL